MSKVTFSVETNEKMIIFTKLDEIEDDEMKEEIQKRLIKWKERLFKVAAEKLLDEIYLKYNIYWEVVIIKK
ncbi:hypothetical protein HGO21_03390 [Acinetobacter sp. CUI P1]|nr:hypothetical protein [Acinetobacter sp. CUI P1]